MGLPRLTKERIQLKLIQQSRGIEYFSGIVDGYHTPIRWLCLKCQHTWKSTPHVVLTCKHGCPRCKLTTNTSVDADIVDKQITRIGNVISASKSILWQCNKCQYMWETTPICITRTEGTGCPNCSNKQRLTNDLVDLRIKKLNLSIKRIGVVKNTHTKIQWECSKQHTWYATPVSIFSHGTGCPHCYSEQGGRGKPVTKNGIYFRSILESNVYNELLKYFSKTEIVTQKRYNTKTRHTCDFYIPKRKIWIEVSNYTDSSYIKNIKKKERWIKKINESFFFISTPQQVKEILV